MTTIRWKLYNELKALFPDADIHITYGAETKERRRAFDVGKKKKNLRIPPHQTTKQRMLFLRRMGYPAQTLMNENKKKQKKHTPDRECVFFNLNF